MLSSDGNANHFLAFEALGQSSQPNRNLVDLPSEGKVMGSNTSLSANLP
jgi:hypothetical protein